MELNTALQIFGLRDDATLADVDVTYRRLRKPLLKELNRHEAAEQPEELTEKLEKVDTAYKVLQASMPDGEATAGGTPRPRSTGRVAFAAGDVVAGRYEIKAMISHRPEGDTYRAHDRVRDTAMALKVIAPELLRDKRVRSRIVHGLRQVVGLNHPNLVRVLDLLELQNTYAVAEQLPEGYVSLWDLMYSPEGDRSRLDQGTVLHLAGQAVRGLSYLQGLAPHGSLRPESLWLDSEGNLKISDFGLGPVHHELRGRRLSRSKLGTAYWAPEQYGANSALDARSDQYALALILYEILSGKPAVGRTQAIRGFRKDYPSRFTAAVERALSSKPDRRFADMNELGQAALPSYVPEGAPPSGSSESLLLPTLVLIALVAAFAFSPIGQAAAKRAGRVVERWHAAEADHDAADQDTRRLRALAARLDERGEALDEASRTELAVARESLLQPELDTGDRAALQDRLSGIVRQLVATSRRRADRGLERSNTALDELAALTAERHAAAETALAADLRTLRAATADTHVSALTDYVRRVAGIDRQQRQLAQVAAQPWQDGGLGRAYRALREAREALAIGDEAATGNAFDRAAEALEAGAAGTETLRQESAAFDPFAKPAGIAQRLDPDDRRETLDHLIAARSDLSQDENVAELAAGLLAEAKDDADVRWLVHDDGYWTFQAALGERRFAAGGTWREEDTAGQQALRLLVIGGEVLARPLELVATHGRGRPGLGDVQAALAAAPVSPRAVWCARRPGETPLAAVSLPEAVRTLRASELPVAGRLPEGHPDCAVVVDGRRFETKNGAFEARVRVPGDVLGRWIRMHATEGTRSGQGTWMHLRADGLAPRVHLLEPAEGASLAAGEEVVVRAFVYDSNLASLTIGSGEPESLRKDDVWVLVELPSQVPARGELKVLMRALDEAGNETRREFTWPIR